MAKLCILETSRATYSELVTFTNVLTKYKFHSYLYSRYAFLFLEHQNKLDDKFSTFGLLDGVVAVRLAVTGLLGVIPALVSAAAGTVGLPYLSDVCIQSNLYFKGTFD
jgi:hypothetical protein